MHELPIAARVYVTSVIAVGLAVVVLAIPRVDDVPEGWLIVVTLSGLVLLSNLLRSPLRTSVTDKNVIDISIEMPVGIASVLMLGPWGAAVVMAVMPFAPGPQEWFKRAFNGGMGVIQAFAAGWIYQYTLGASLINADFDIRGDWAMAKILVAIVVMEVVNGLLVVAVISLSERVSPVRVWFGTLAESAFPLFIYSIFGLLLAMVWSFAGPISAVLVLAPLMVARWVFAQFAARQAAYEATMRSLIKAVETKDLYTRGHSERV
jgi:hypothetical protein